MTVTGEKIGTATGLLISGDPGVTALLQPRAENPAVTIESSKGGISAAEVRNDKSLTAKIAIKDDARLGARELRIATATGVSNPLVLNVAAEPQINEQQPNDSPGSAQAIELPVAVLGRINAANESDYFKFKAKQGEHLTFEVYGARLGSPLDSSLAVLDSKGKELARNEDSQGLDSVIDWDVPADGEYVIQLRDFQYRGAGNYRYRLVAGSLPHASYAFPFGGQRGKNVEVEITGYNLGGTTKIALKLEPDAPLGRQEIRAQTALGVSNPFPFEIGELPEVMEKEPNSAIDQADEIKVPMTVNGRIQAEKDYDAFKFRAEKDQQYTFEVFANRFGSPLDALLSLTDASGNVIKRNDDSSGADAKFDHRFEESGDYVVLIEDLLGRGAPNFGYRLTIRQPQPDFSVKFLPDNPRINRGGHAPIRCELTRANGFNETVRVTAANLPSGLFAAPLLLTPASPPSGFIVLSAGESAPLETVPLKLVATTVRNGKEVSRAAEPLTGDKVVKEAFVTVLDRPPFTIDLATLTASVEQNQTSKVEVLVRRRSDFNGEIKLAPEGFSSGREPITRSAEFEPITLKATETRAELKLKAKVDSEVGTRPIFVRGETSIDGQVYSQFSSTLPLTIVQIPFVLSTTLKRLSVTALPPGAQSAAGEATFTVKAERRAGFTGEVNLVLEGLPEGITATVDKVAANSVETIVKLVATEQAPTGKEYTLSLIGTGVFNDRNYKYRPAEIKLSINAPVPEEAPKTVAQRESEPAVSK
ncbi:MAG: PPC domain-containing protein [Verrucomicrobiales bacterium]|nr:PPC domain-containing protein [Verrucomicrobiales bacterium]